MYIGRIYYSTIWIIFTVALILLLFRTQIWQTKVLENWAWWQLNKGLAGNNLYALQASQGMFSRIWTNPCQTNNDYCALLSDKLDASNYLVNGGFEFNQQAWVINLPQDVSIGFSEDVVHTGNRSLTVRFHGGDVNFYHIFQEVEVSPSHCYDLTAHIRAETLTGQVGLDIWDAERGYQHWYGGQTQLIGDTTHWEPVYLSFCTPEDVFRIQVRLRRFGGRGEGITGTVWFDTIRLQGNES